MNPFASALDDLEGVEKLHSLQGHGNIHIGNRCGKILAEHFGSS